MFEQILMFIPTDIDILYISQAISIAKFYVFYKIYSILSWFRNTVGLWRDIWNFPLTV